MVALRVSGCYPGIVDYDRSHDLEHPPEEVTSCEVFRCSIVQIKNSEDNSKNNENGVADAVLFPGGLVYFGDFCLSGSHRVHFGI